MFIQRCGRVALTLLVTGWTGLLGHAVVRRHGGPGVRLLARSVGRIPPGAEVLVGDVRNPDTLAAALDGVDAVIHLAAQTSYRVAEQDPTADRRINVDPVQAMISVSAADGVRRAVVTVGSESQAGMPTLLPLDESTRDEPLTVYDRHKLEAERLAIASRHVCGVGLRLPTVYGPGPPERCSDRGMVGAVIRRGLSGGPVQIFGSGLWRRDLPSVSRLRSKTATVSSCGSGWDLTPVR
jgi:nucleoside-diphosphate-sugar epimerase